MRIKIRLCARRRDEFVFSVSAAGGFPRKVHVMERLTKAALATGGAAALLLGGAGTLAYWTAEGTATGPDLVAGSFTVTATECDDAWTLDDGTPLPADGAIVPGDTVTLECVYTM